jgi:hypothetical protein
VLRVKTSQLRDGRENAMSRDVAEIELLDEVVEWLDSLTGAELERVVGVVEGLARRR